MNHGTKIMVLAAVIIFILAAAAGCLCPFTWQVQKTYETGNAVQDSGQTNDVEPVDEETGAVSGSVSREWEPEEYSGFEIEYFLETAMGAEYGTHDSAVHKWVDDIRIDLKGNPTAEDKETLNQVISELNYLIDGITLSIVNWNGDIEIYFTEQDKFYSIEPNYVSGNIGFFWAWWDSSGALDRARILIATDGITQKERNHLIWEELTQSLGIMNDSYEYPESIFYQEWSDVNGYSDMDRAVIRILYDPRIKPGMNISEVEEILGW